jgi:uncharacterized protein YgiM (DUF1202 family)
MGGAFITSAPFILTSRVASADTLEPILSPTRRPFARAIQAGIVVRESPSVKSKIIRTLKINEVVPVEAQTESNQSPTSYNKIWYKTRDGYAHSAYLQPAENKTQKPVLDAVGFWVEASVPTVPVRTKPDSKASIAYNIFFGCTLQILEAVEGDNKSVWYRVSDGNSEKLFVLAEQLRRIDVSEFTPISPNVPLENKRIEVSIAKQLVSAYEYDKLVYTARCATGAKFVLKDGRIDDYSTTKGDHRIFLKTPSRRMIGGAFGDSDYYDLPGIPWVAYFTASRIAFHGAYWHNDYGNPRSHGCVNMLPEDAQWVYRWTSPVAPYEERWTRTESKGQGSLVRVF